MRRLSENNSESEQEATPNIDRANILCDKSLSLIAKHIKVGLTVIHLGMMLNIPNTTVVNYMMCICGKYGLRDASEREIYQLGKNILLYWLRTKENCKPKEKVTLLTTALVDCGLEKLANVILDNYNNHTEITEEQVKK